MSRRNSVFLLLVIFLPYRIQQLAASQSQAPAQTQQSTSPSPAASPAPQSQEQAPAATHGQEPAVPDFARQMIGFKDHREIPPEVVERGKSLYSVSCSFCHGSDARGGSIGPNLLRSEVVLQDQNGELIAPIVHGSRAEKGMPAIELNDGQVSDVAGFLHNLRVAGRDFANRDPINIVVGDATAGKATYGRMCASCHAEAQSFKYLIDAIPDPRTFQQAWLLPGSPGNMGFGGAPNKYPGSKVPPVGVTVTVDGRATTGTLERIDDFYVALKTPDGATHSFERLGDLPKVEIHDPVHAHREMFRTIKDSEIHDITAYLVTLK